MTFSLSWLACWAPGTPPLLSVRLLDQVRERFRYLHYSLSTEKTYLYWIRFFIRWHGLKHPPFGVTPFKLSG